MAHTQTLRNLVFGTTAALGIYCFGRRVVNHAMRSPFGPYDPYKHGWVVREDPEMPWPTYEDHYYRRFLYDDPEWDFFGRVPTDKVSYMYLTRSDFLRLHRRPNTAH